jgi:NADPH:quinone reductase-like Zn-dependent oxidoreductase
LGCDVAGVVVKAGPKAIGPLGPLKEGDDVCGCTRLGSKGYSACEEFLLMDPQVTIPKPKNIDLAQAATVGVGFDTACLGVFMGMGVDVPKDPAQLPAHHGKWALVFGGSSSVGKYAVQLLKALGFNVATTCSSSSAPLLTSLGAAATIDYKKSQEEQLNELLSKTDGKLYRIFDATAQSHELARAIFSKIRDDKTKK